MSPTPRDVRIDPLLTKVSIGYKSTDFSFMAEQLSPIVTVMKDAAKIATYSRDLLRISESLRAPGQPSNEVDFRVSIGDHYLLVDHSLKGLADDETKENADNPINIEIDLAETITMKLLVEKEKALSDVLFNTSVITNNVTLTGTDKWSDLNGSNPFTDVSTGLTAARKASGKKPNTVAMGDDVFRQLQNHPEVHERVKYVMNAGNSNMTSELLALAFGVKKVMVGDAAYEPGNEGQADSAELTDIWSNDVALLHVDANPGLKSRTTFLTYQKSGMQRRVDKWRDIDREGNWIRVKDKYDQKLIDAQTAYLIKDAV